MGLFRLPGVRRAFGALAALLLFGARTADAHGGNGCEHHDRLPTLPAAGAHAAAHTPEAHGSHEAPNDERPHGCTCVGSCSVTSGVALPSNESGFVALAAATAASEAHTGLVCVSARDFLLPYALGPPSTL